MSALRFAAALVFGKFCAWFCDVFFPKRGSNLPGEIALKFDPLFLRRVKGMSKVTTIFVTGTNGKSTANNMIAHAFRTAGLAVASNLEGANMKPGAATTLLKNMTIGGRFTKTYLILEVDERSLALIAKDLPPRQLCVTNIQKDQVQRNGDPDYIYNKIRPVVSALGADSVLYVNNEEPRCKSLARNMDANGVRVVSYGVAENARSSEIEAVYGVTAPCPVCHDALVFTRYNLAGVGFFHCPSCGFCSDETPDLQVGGVDFENETFEIAGASYRLAYAAGFFLYNYALCAAVCFENGIGADTLAKAFDSFTNIGGRMERFSYGGKLVRYMRIKQENPETLQNALDTIACDKTEKAFVIGPAVVDDIVPHYSNTFYTFDCNFDALIRSGLERCVCFGGTIGFDTANRLRYAGVPDDKIEIVDTDDDEKILAAIAGCRSDNIYLITWIKKYEKLKERAG